mgnify:CR=1 FL=1
MALGLGGEYAAELLRQSLQPLCTDNKFPGTKENQCPVSMLRRETSRETAGC